ncbi:hypothetical protein HY061_02615 [Candidatus Azambacteria bacterium]|nr:hypothetical protein [Candidatus Azambacteria bacterium]
MSIINPTKLVLELLSDIPVRHREVLLKRYGLLNGGRRTLEDVGNDYQITRERIRQIEEAGLKYINKLDKSKELKDVFDLFYSHLQSHGDLRHEEKLLMHDVSKIFGLDKHDKNLMAMIYFILTLGDAFDRFPQTENYHAAWTINKKSFARAKIIIDQVVAMLAKRKEVVKEVELLEMMEIAAKKHLKTIDEKILRSYLDLSKDIASNIYNEYGLKDWPEVNPHSMRDRAYIILKKEKKPLHFLEITQLINKSGLCTKPVHKATVHNDLIRDPRFILCGRGLYALKEWGYEEGTIKDILINMFKKNNQPKTKEEIIKYVLSKRDVKAGTVVLNLQDKKNFIKLKDGRYSLK